MRSTLGHLKNLSNGFKIGIRKADPRVACMIHQARHIIDHSQRRSRNMINRLRQKRRGLLYFRLGLAFIAALGIALLAASGGNAPTSLAVGMSVRVANVGEQELNIRSLPSVADSQILFRAADGSAFHIIGGPRSADGFIWWQIQDMASQLGGWAVANYLQAYQVKTGQSQ